MSKIMKNIGKALLTDTLWILLIIGASGLISDMFPNIGYNNLHLIPAYLFALCLTAAIVLWNIPVPYLIPGGIWMYGLLLAIKNIPLFPIAYLDNWNLYTPTPLTNPNTEALFFCLNGVLWQVFAVVLIKFLPKLFGKIGSYLNRKKEDVGPNRVSTERIVGIVIGEIVWLLPFRAIMDIIIFWFSLTSHMPPVLIHLLMDAILLLMLSTATAVCFRNIRGVLLGIPIQIAGMICATLFHIHQKVGILSMIVAELNPILLIVIGNMVTVTLQISSLIAYTFAGRKSQFGLKDSF